MMKQMRRKKDLAIEGLTARWYNKNSRNHRLGEMKEYATLMARCEQWANWAADTQDGSKRVGGDVPETDIQIFSQERSLYKGGIRKLVHPNELEEFLYRRRGHRFQDLASKVGRHRTTLVSLADNTTAQASLK
jgi:hypothetical protein